MNMQGVFLHVLGDAYVYLPIIRASEC
jgi:Co/Zn/Cd efflux system component